jgi:hypothetical protein
MHLSLAEYIERKEDKPTPAPVVIQATTVKASGRTQHTSGQMNGLEKKYAQHLEMRKMVGEIIDYKFEPLKLKLAPSTFYNPDFLLLMPDRTIELHETKGSSKNRSTGVTKPFYEDDAIVKIKVASTMFPEFIFVMAWEEKGVGWKFKRFG